MTSSFTVSDESHEQQRARFARIRRTKWLLRFTPRRAAFHRYPLIGRFAAFARARSYLWSFRTENVRPAIYAGSITALLPIMGVQLPVAFVLAFLLRANVMVLGGLQFVTNPFTAVPIYWGTYQLGQTIIHQSGFGTSVDVVHDPAAQLRPSPGTELDDTGPPHAEVKWTQRFGTAINAFVLGGVISGIVLGFILDLLWRFGLNRARHHRAHRPPRRGDSGSTGRHPPPM